MLAFQTRLQFLRGKKGWLWSDKRTPKFLEEFLENDVKLQLKFDQLKMAFYDIIFPSGFDKPSIRSVPLSLRALGPNLCNCAVLPSKGKNYGLFVTEYRTGFHMPRITSFNSSMDKVQALRGLRVQARVVPGQFAVRSANSVIRGILQ